jgi:hypothetical protein
MSRSGRFGSVAAALTTVALSATFAAALQSATALPAHADGGLSCNYVIVASWPAGYSADLTIINNSGNAINGWTASWNFQHATAVTNTWSGSITQGTPFDATGSNMSWNAMLPPGSATTFGWIATAAVPDVPDVVTVNGTRCPVNGRS